MSSRANAELDQFFAAGIADGRKPHPRDVLVSAATGVPVKTLTAPRPVAARGADIAGGRSGGLLR